MSKPGLHTKRRLRFRMTTVIFVAIFFLVELAAFNTNENLLYLLAAFVIGFPALGAVVSKLSFRGVELRRDAPGAVHRGEAFTVATRLKNTKRLLPGVSLRVGFSGEAAGAYLAVLPANTSATLGLPRAMPRRGVHVLPGIELASAFPMGFVERKVVLRDGYRDAIATGWSSDVIVQFPGHPEKYFADPIITSLAGGPRDLVLEDLDGDGALDLAVTLYNSDEIAILKGSGTGKFDLIDKISARGKMPQRIRAADVNGDRRRDLVVSYAQSDDCVVLFYGDGNFRFEMSQEIRLGADRFRRDVGVQDIVIRDFNADDKADIALACSDAGAVILLRNASDGKSLPLKFEQEVFPFDGGAPHALAAEDISIPRDGRPDLAVALWGADSIALLINQP